MDLKPSAVELHIGELSLGFDPLHAARLRRAVESELAQLLSEHALPTGRATGGTVDRIDAGSFALPVGGRPETVGASIAMAVWKGLP